MAATYTWEDLLTYIHATIPRIQQNQFAPIFCQNIQAFMWDVADWRETIDDMPPFHPIPGEQDLTGPMVCLPSDFKGLRKCQLFQISADPPTEYPVPAGKDLAETSREDITESIAYEPSLNAIRLYPRFPQGFDASDWVFRCTYKKQPTKVTAATLTNTLPFDDDNFHVMADVGHFLLAKMNPARIREVPGLYQNAMLALEGMAEEEGLNLGQSVVAPAEPLDAFRGRF